MANAQEIRENAKKDIVEWFSRKLKESVKTYYKIFRLSGLSAALCLAMAKKQIEIEMNDYGKKMFHSHIPKET